MTFPLRLVDVNLSSQPIFSSLINMFHDLDSELVRAWQLLNELSDTNSRNRELAANLRNYADALKVPRFAIST